MFYCLVCSHVLEFEVPIKRSVSKWDIFLSGCYSIREGNEYWFRASSILDFHLTEVQGN